MIETINSAGSIQTFSGIFFDPFNPDPAAIDIEDIAHALSNQCRYSGHVKKFYSVAQHSYLVASYCSLPNKLWGLLHDASEAYLVDLPRPIKRHTGMALYRTTESIVMNAVCDRFGLDREMSEEVHEHDNHALVGEARHLLHGVDHWLSWPELQGMDTRGVESWLAQGCWEPKEAKERFLSLYRYIIEDK